VRNRRQVTATSPATDLRFLIFGLLLLGLKSKKTVLGIRRIPSRTGARGRFKWRRAMLPDRLKSICYLHRGGIQPAPGRFPYLSVALILESQVPVEHCQFLQGGLKTSVASSRSKSSV